MQKTDVKASVVITQEQVVEQAVELGNATSALETVNIKTDNLDQEDEDLANELLIN